jgi:hypothetical protein
MGLDISAYSRIQKVEDTDEASIYIRRNIPELDQGQDIEEGEYKEADDCEAHGFRAGSYSGYGVFRNLLSEKIHGVSSKEIWENPEIFSDKEFYNLINFSDCEGFFGPCVSKKLHQDFIDNREKFTASIQEVNPYPGYYERVYDDFTLGFEIASKGGVLLFH